MAVLNAVNFYVEQGFKVYGRADAKELGNVSTKAGICSADFYISTAGGIATMVSLVARAGKFLDHTNATMMIDEAHDDDASNQSVLEWAHGKSLDITLVTATPVQATIPMHKKLAQNWVIAQHAASSSGLYVNDHVMDSIGKGMGHINAIVSPSLDIASTVLDNILDKFPQDCVRGRIHSAKGVEISYAGKVIFRADCTPENVLSGAVKAAKMGKPIWYVATPVIEVGVTIPNLALVIDCGVDIDRTFSDTDLAKGKFKTQRTLRPRTVASFVQVAGRVSHTHGYSCIAGFC